MAFGQHLYNMIVVDMDRYQASGEGQDGATSTMLFRQFQENLLARVDEEIENTFLANDINLDSLAYDGDLIIPELCFELHHRVRSNLFNADLMKKALYCLAVGRKLTRSMTHFLGDCFESAHSTAVDLFQEYNGIETLRQHIRAMDTDSRGFAQSILRHYYIAVAQGPTEMATAIFSSEFGRMRHSDVLPDVVGGVFQILQESWTTNFQRITSLRKDFHPTQDYNITYNSFADVDLTSNFASFLQMFDRYPDIELWRKILVSISRVNKRGPPPFGMRTQIVPTFEAIEELKNKAAIQGPSYDLYILMGPGDASPLIL
jgi:hypothetical protein